MNLENGNLNEISWLGISYRIKVLSEFNGWMSLECSHLEFLANSWISKTSSEHEPVEEIVESFCNHFININHEFQLKHQEAILMACVRNCNPPRFFPWTNTKLLKSALFIPNTNPQWIKYIGIYYGCAGAKLPDPEQ